MIFVSLGKFRKKPTIEMTTEVGKIPKAMTGKEGVKILGFYWLLAGTIQ